MVEWRYLELKVDIKRRWIRKCRKSDLAQLVEHSTENRKVIGATPIIEANGGMVGYNHLAFYLPNS